MKILVAFALENEFAPWREQHEFRSAPRDGAETYAAEIAGALVEVVLTGAGPKHASAVASKVMRGAEESIDCCVSAGLAGALRPEYRIGQVLAARAVESEVAPESGESGVVQSSEALISFAGECGATLVERFHTAGRVIGRAAEKKYLGETADAVEMESYEILCEAQRRGVPAAAVRAVSDLSGDDLPFDMTGIFTSEGRISMPLVMAQVARHPRSLSAVMKLGESAKTAAAGLAALLDRYVERLAAAVIDPKGKSASAKP